MIETAAGPADVALLTHASNDLTVLHQAQAQLPSGFARVAGVNLQSLDADTSMAAWLAGDLRAA
jgi:cobaltochelatase CobN